MGQLRLVSHPHIAFQTSLQFTLQIYIPILLSLLSRIYTLNCIHGSWFRYQWFWCQVDVFSFAMVIYEIICREVPFEEEAPVTALGSRRGAVSPSVRLPFWCSLKSLYLIVFMIWLCSYVHDLIVFMICMASVWWMTIDSLAIQKYEYSCHRMLFWKTTTTNTCHLSNPEILIALHFTYHRFSINYTSYTRHTGYLRSQSGLPGAGGRGEVHSGRHSSWHGCCPAGYSSGVDLLDEGRLGELGNSRCFQKAKVVVVQCNNATMDEILWNDTAGYEVGKYWWDVDQFS